MFTSAPHQVQHACYSVWALETVVILRTRGCWRAAGPRPQNLQNTKTMKHLKQQMHDRTQVDSLSEEAAAAKRQSAEAAARAAALQSDLQQSEAR